MKHNISTYWLWLVTVALLGLIGCVWIKNAGEQRSLTVVDGVQLKHQNAITLSQDYDSDSLEIMGETLSLELQGIKEPKVHIRISYMEYLPGDATVYLAKGKITSRTKSGKPVAICSIMGNIPEGLNLDIKNGTGSAMLTALKGNQNVNITTGTGSIDVIDSRFTCLNAKTGTGSIGLKDSNVQEVKVKTGTGNINLSKSTISKRDFYVGTGKIVEEN